MCNVLLVAMLMRWEVLDSPVEIIKTSQLEKSTASSIGSKVLIPMELEPEGTDLNFNQRLGGLVQGTFEPVDFPHISHHSVKYNTPTSERRRFYKTIWTFPNSRVF